MNKIAFLQALEEKLKALPKEDRTRSLEYYFEIIDDHMDEGMTEEEAVAACGSVEEIAQQILMDTPLPKLVKQTVKPKRRMRAWEIVLLAVGSPLWLSLLIAAMAIILAICVVLWVVVIAIYAAAIVCGAVGTAMAAMATVSLVQGQFLPALFFFGCGLICAGLTILLFIAGTWAAKGVLALIKLMFRGIKRCFVRKEAKG